MLPFLYVSLFHTLIILNCLGAWCRSNVRWVYIAHSFSSLSRFLPSVPVLCLAVPYSFCAFCSFPFPFPCLLLSASAFGLGLNIKGIG